MARDPRKNRSQLGRQSKRQVTQGQPTKGLLTVALVAGVALLALVLAGMFWRGDSLQPQEHPTPKTAGSGPVSSSPREIPEPIPSPQAPVPDDYEGLKQEALVMALQLHRRCGDAPHAVSVLASIYFDAGNLTEATRCWKQCLERYPDCAEGYYRLGLYARKERNDQQAADYLHKAFQLDRTLPDIQGHLGRSLLTLNRVHEALDVLQIDVQPDRRDSIRYFFLGHAYLRTQQYDKAKTAFQTAVKITPSFTGAHYGLATACTKLKQDEQARQHLEDFRKLKAQDTQSAGEAVKTGDVVRMRQSVASWYTTAGKLYAINGDQAQAEAHWLRAAAINPEDPQCRRLLFDLYQHQGDRQHADRVADEIRNLRARQGN